MGYPNRKFEIRNSEFEIKLLAPAKINIGLLVKEKLTSGYHRIETIMVPIKLFDTLIINKREKGIGFKTDSKTLPRGKTNLVLKSARLFFDTVNMQGGAEIYLQKRIPIGAGLGGGSSDAAHTLLGLNHIYGNVLTLKQLHNLAVKIGMDVPFFLYGSACYATGRGEILKQISLPKFSIVLYVPKYSVSTKWAYQNVDVGLTPLEMHQNLESVSSAPKRFLTGLTDNSFSLKILMKKLKHNDLADLNAFVCNTFENLVFSKHPDLLKIKNLFLAHGADTVSLSGSGSAIFGIFNKDVIRKISKKLGKEVFITETL